MNSRGLLLYSWCALVAGIFLMSCFATGGRLSESLVPYYESMWARFFVYSAATTIPLILWQKRQHAIYGVAVIVLSAVFEIRCALALERGGHQVDTFAELFGVAAGVLLGLNLRRLRASALRAAHRVHKQDGSAVN